MRRCRLGPAVGVSGVLFLSGCAAEPVVKAAPHYVVGEGYEADGVWHYPREDFGYDRTGLAAVYGAGVPLITADGEVYDPHAMAGASPVLQLPAIVKVTALTTGRQLLLRINDRGPANAGRILAVTPYAAALLGFPADGVAEVRVAVQPAASEALASDLGGGIRIAAAPMGGFQATSLAPPPGIAETGGGAIGLTDRANTRAPASAAPPLRLPVTLTAVPPDPGALYIRSGSFGRSADAWRQSARLAGLPDPRVVGVAGQGRPLWGVETGPYPTVAAADAGLAATLGAGAVDATIIVQ